MRGRSGTGLLPPVILGLMLLPVAAGLAGTVMPAMGHLPAAGFSGFSLMPFAMLAETPGLGRAVGLSIWTGIAATALSLAITILIAAGWAGTRAFGRLERGLAPLLAVPHAAAAFGLAFLIAPSGWIARLVSPWLTGWTRPPDLLVLADPAGLALIAGLVIKEVPFLMLMLVAALPQANPAQRIRLARSLGYGPVRGWLRGVLPAIYPQIRLPIYAVLAYSMTAIDTALILGPTTPPTLSILILRWTAQPALDYRLVAAAGAMLQLGLVVGALALWRLAEIGYARLMVMRVCAGARGGHGAETALRALGGAVTALVSGILGGGLVTLALWSIAGPWGFPMPLPEALTGVTWARHAAHFGEASLNTAFVALTTTAIALVLALTLIETAPAGQRADRAGWLIYLPLIVPQISFLPGLQTALIGMGLGQGFTPVVMAHLVFVFPYVLLSLADPHAALDPRYDQMARSLRQGAWARLWRVRLPLLLRPMLTAAAVGMSVSVALYLPTLLAGGGRIATLTTEALALAAGGDRRAISVFALVQGAAALVPFVVAALGPAIIWRNRRDLRHG